MKDFIEGEEWRDVVGYEEFYEVSNFGRIYNKPRRVFRKNSFYNIKGKIKWLCIDHGYYVMTLNTGFTPKKAYAHKLVALAFIPNPHNKPFIDHIDGNPLNNHVDNLRWCTYSENVKNRRAHGTSKYLGVCLAKGRKKWMAQINAEGIHKYLGSFDTEEEAARCYDDAARLYHGEFANPNFPLI